MYQFTTHLRSYIIYLVCYDGFVVVHPRVKLPSAEFPPPTSRDSTSSNAAEWSTCNLVYGVSKGQRLMYNPKLYKQNVYVFVHSRALEILFQISILKTGCLLTIYLA